MPTFPDESTSVDDATVLQSVAGGHFQEVDPTDVDYFHLTQTSGTLYLSVLPDWGLIDFGMGQQLFQETFLGAWLSQVEEIYKDGVLIDTRLVQIAMPAELTDSILQIEYGNQFGGTPPTFLNFNLTLPAETSITEFGTTYVFKADFYLIVTGNPSAFGSIYTVTDAYAVAIGNPTGVRASLWGSDWVNVLQPAPPPPPPPPDTDIPAEAFDVTAPNPSTMIVESEPFILNPSTDTWSVELGGVVTALDYLGMGADALWTGITDEIDDQMSNFIDQRIADVAPQFYPLYTAVKDAYEQVQPVREGLTGFLQSAVDILEHGMANDPNTDLYLSEADALMAETDATWREAAYDKLGGVGDTEAGNIVSRFINGLLFGKSNSDPTFTMIFNDVGVGGSPAPVTMADGHHDSIWGSGYDDIIHLADGNDFAVGAAGNDQLFGDDGDDILFGASGSDHLDGGAGNDRLVGGTESDTLEGGAGNDSLDGGIGADAMAGGLGDDKFFIDNAGDTVSEIADEGDDIAFVLGTYTLEQGISIETLYALDQTSTDPLVLTGNEYGQSLYGNLGDNYLNGGQAADHLVGLDGNDNLLGGTGADHMEGGTGNDVYYVDEAADLITELAGEGDNDILVATASYTLGVGVSIETMSVEQTSAPINLTGNELAQSLYGNAGNNILTGAGGADFMVGGAGNDKYYVDVSDFIGEDVGGGDDWIFVSTSYTLREGNEIETLVAVNQDSLAQVDFAGNEFGQSLYGSQGVNNLNGGAGNDYLVGLGGNDFLIGGAGNDNLQGGAGNDLYYVDGGDQIFESAGEGDDLAVALESFALGSGQSVETLSAADSAGSINLTGNALGQSFYGNAGANVLTSGGGADFMVGGAGNDTFVLTNAPGVATVGDYTAGDVVDITQFLSVANGTNVTAAGYVRIVGSQLQVDANGGGDGFVTIGNVSGSGNVTVRYQSGGSPTDLSVARSAGQEAQAQAIVDKTALDAGHALLDHASAPQLAHDFAGEHDQGGFDPWAFHLDSPGIV